MKKVIVGSLFSVACIALLLPVAAVKSEESNVSSNSTATKTEAGFKAGGGANPVTPIKPDDKVPPTPIEPEENLPHVDGVTLTHVPTISFGTDNQISAAEVNYQAMTQKITVPSLDLEYYLPHFVQVADTSGKFTQWEVTVLQTQPYTQKDLTGKVTSTLENTRIRLYQNSVVSEYAEKAAKVNGIKKENGFATIPLKEGENTSGIVVEQVADSTKTGVSGSVVSSVFEDDYTVEKYYNGTVQAAGKEATRYEGIQLNVPKGEDVKNGTYAGELTWVLTVSP